jgi:hypothetical protein
VTPGFPYLWVLTDLEAWCEKWDLKPFDTPCPDCGATVHVDRPFAAADGIRGLGADACACGSDLSALTYVGGPLRQLDR